MAECKTWQVQLCAYEGYGSDQILDSWSQNVIAVDREGARDQALRLNRHQPGVFVAGIYETERRAVCI